MENRFSIVNKASACFFLISIFLYNSCIQKSFHSETEMIEYLKDDQNGYIQHKTVNGYDFSLSYRPTDLLVNQEIEGDEITEDMVEGLRDKYKNYLYFNLSISRNNQELLSTVPKDRMEFGAMVNDLAFGMRDKVNLFTKSKDTIDMIDFVYPRMYGMSRATTMMFVFPREGGHLNEDFLNFTVEDLGLFTGEVKFKVYTDIIKNEPQLSFKN
ncbi:MAG: hypothetical protein ACK5M1_13895 [Xanthomarina gelatinilytica]|uniref:hypothetical protein n=1 Tax=Xanthomarina gelatinilytica TaxID=1137281 RepID=UPI003A871EF0